MLKQFLTNAVTLRTLAAVLTLAFSTPAAHAEEVPFFVLGSGEGAGFSVAGVPSPFRNHGISFPGGRYKGKDGVAIAQSFDPTIGAGTFKGTFTFATKRGRLVTTFGDTSNGAAEVGTYEAIPVGGGLARILFIAEFNPIDGESTGAFKNVSDGSLIMYALTNPIPLIFDDQGFSVPFDFDWIGSGYLAFGDDD